MIKIIKNIEIIKQIMCWIFTMVQTILDSSWYLTNEVINFVLKYLINATSKSKNVKGRLNYEVFILCYFTHSIGYKSEDLCGYGNKFISVCWRL